MVYGIKWYSEGLYWVTTAGESLTEFKRLKSDSTAHQVYNPDQAMDLAWNKVISTHPKSEGFYYSFPDLSKASSTIGITVYPTAGQFYNRQTYNFDRHTLASLSSDDVYSKSYAESGFGGKLRKMNYDIHVGSILGFPGKVLAFLASLIGASLPITGFLIWYGRKFKKKGKKKKLPTTSEKSGYRVIAKKKAKRQLISVQSN